MFAYYTEHIELSILDVSIHSSPLRYLTQEKWIPTFWRPILNILDFQMPEMKKINRTVQVAIFCFKAEKIGQKLMKLIEIFRFTCVFCDFRLLLVISRQK